MTENIIIPSPLLSAFGGVILPDTTPPPVLDFTPEFGLSVTAENTNKMRQFRLDSLTDNSVNIVSNFEDLKAAYRGSQPFTTIRFKYAVAAFLDNTLQLRLSRGIDRLAVNIKINHDQMFLGQFGNNSLYSEQTPDWLCDRIVAAGFLMIKNDRIYIDGGSGTFPTSANSVLVNWGAHSAAQYCKIDLSNKAGLIPAQKLLQTIFPDKTIIVVNQSGL